MFTFVVPRPIAGNLSPSMSTVMMLSSVSLRVPMAAGLHQKTIGFAG